MFFDLHLHPSTKAFLTSTENNNRASCREQIEVKLFFRLDEHPIHGGDRLDSQSCLQQLLDGNIVLGVFPLHAMERDFADASIFDKIKIFINAGRSTHVPSWRLFHNIVSFKKGFLPYELMQSELQLLQRDTGSDFELLKSMNGTQPRQGKISAMISLEGGHCFLTDERTDSFDHINPVGWKEIVKRLEDFVNHTNTPRIAYITLTHIGRSPMCTQAFSYAQRKEKNICEPFIPRDAGTTAIRPIGWKLIRKSLENGILIDVKHMSYRARCEYYSFLKQQQQQGKVIPVVASHMGATGMSFATLKAMWKHQGSHYTAERIKVPRPTGLGNRKFYGITLNLFDEEIRFIVASKGLIGISLDERILGQKLVKRSDSTDETFEYDYLSPNDYNYLNSTTYNQDTATLFTATSTAVFQSQGNYSTTDPKEEGLYYLCNNILRFVFAGGKEAWNHICLGSDYDGLIDALECSRTSVDIATLKNSMKPVLIKLIMSVPNPIQAFHVNLNNLDADLDIKIDALFYGNGYNFLQKHFQGNPVSMIV